MLSKPVLAIHDVVQRLTANEQTIRCWMRAHGLAKAKLNRAFGIAAKSLDAVPNTPATRAPDRPPDAGRP